MLKINFDKSGNWYEGMDFEGSHLVTSDKHNADLGISSIRLKKPNGDSERVVASVRVYFMNGLEMFGTLYPSNSGEGFNFGVDRRDWIDGATGEKKFQDINVRVPMAIQAQIMRYATTKSTSVASAPRVLTPAQIKAKAEAQERLDFAEYKKQQALAKAQQAPVVTETVAQNVEVTANELQDIADSI